jgi:hypothetical protein
MLFYLANLLINPQYLKMIFYLESETYWVQYEQQEMHDLEVPDFHFTPGLEEFI